MEKAWKVVLAFIGVFIAGAVFGGLFTLRATKRVPVEPVAAVEPPVTPLPVANPNPVAPRPAPEVARPLVAASITPAMVRAWTQRLNLTAEQREKVKQVVERGQEDFRRLRQDTTRVQERMYADVVATLTPEQKAELDEMKRKIQEQQDRKKQRDAGDKTKSGVNARPPS